MAAVKPVIDIVPSVIQGSKIASDFIMLVPERTVDALAIRVQDFVDQGVQRIGLMVAVCIKGLDTVIGANVRHGDKAAIAAELRDIFRTGQREYTIEMAWTKWQVMCDRWGKDYRAI